jgi:hypothetical protein
MLPAAPVMVTVTGFFIVPPGEKHRTIADTSSYCRMDGGARSGVAGAPFPPVTLVIHAVHVYSIGFWGASGRIPAAGRTAR